MICEGCGRPYRFHGPPTEPPENHFYRCDRCNRTYYPYSPEEDDD